MKLKAASGYACYVQDLTRTADFYLKLGLEIKSRSSERLIVYLNWYRIDFVTWGSQAAIDVQEESIVEPKGAGLFLYFSVDDVDETYNEVISLGIEPASEPTDMPWGNREFTLRDPDGYKIVLFKRKVAKNPTD